jgi:hypothetical protein
MEAIITFLGLHIKEAESTMGSFIFILKRTVLMAAVVVETAQPLFHGMIISVFWAAVSFFDTTPSSQILSRVGVVCYIHRSIKL